MNFGAVFLAVRTTQLK